jgi:hypothetical protein
VEVVRANLGIRDVERCYSLRFDVDYTVLVLERAFDPQEPVACKSCRFAQALRVFRSQPILLFGGVSAVWIQRLYMQL